MTEGIIQKTFGKYMDKAINDWLYLEEDMIQDLLDLRQELITEIKSQSFDIEFVTYEYEKIIRLIQLIGDNKE